MVFYDSGDGDGAVYKFVGKRCCCFIITGWWFFFGREGR